jgi:hypothetical protein
MRVAAMRAAAMRAGVPCSWMIIAVVALYAFAGDGCGSQRSTGSGSRAPTSAQLVTARTYRGEVSTVCRRYNAEIMQIGRKERGSRKHEVQLARATDAVTASEARALMQIPRPPGFGRFERLYRTIMSAADVAGESTWLFSTGKLERANAAALVATRELRGANAAFRQLGLSTCAE